MLGDRRLVGLLGSRKPGLVGVPRQENREVVERQPGQKWARQSFRDSRRLQGRGSILWLMRRSGAGSADQRD